MGCTCKTCTEFFIPGKLTGYLMCICDLFARVYTRWEGGLWEKPWFIVSSKGLLWVVELAQKFLLQGNLHTVGMQKSSMKWSLV